MTTKEERAEEIGAGESGHCEGDEETKVNDEILPTMPQRQSRCKRVLGAGEKCGATSGGMEIGIGQHEGRMGHVKY